MIKEAEERGTTNLDSDTFFVDMLRETGQDGGVEDDIDPDLLGRSATAYRRRRLAGGRLKREQLKEAILMFRERRVGQRQTQYFRDTGRM